MATCREVTERTNRYLDGDLGFWPALQVKLHMLACRYCRRFVRQMRTAACLVKEYGYTLPPDDVDESVLDAFRKCTRDTSA